MTFSDLKRHFYSIPSRSPWTTGWSADGQTGLGTYEPVRKPQKVNLPKVVSVKSAGDFVLALTKNGELYGWGNNEHAQLSEFCDEQQVNKPIRLHMKKYFKNKKIVEIGCTANAGFAILENNQVYSWGHGLTLGLGPETKYTKIPREIELEFFGKNKDFNECRVRKIVGGIDHVVAITNDGGCYGWGRNRDGRLGNNTFRDFSYPFPIILKQKCVDVSCGSDHTIFVTRFVT